MMRFLAAVAAIFVGLGQSALAADQIDPESGCIGCMFADAADVSGVFEALDAKFPKEKGVVIAAVEANSPAATAGLRQFDFISRVNGREVSVDELVKLIAGSSPGQKLSFTGYRPVRGRNKVAWRRKDCRVSVDTTRTVVFNAMSSVEDDVTGLTLYTHVSSPTGNVEVNDLSCYFYAKRYDPQPLRLRIQTAQDGWIFVNRFQFRIGQETFEIDASDFFNDVNREVGVGGVSEWYDAPVDSESAAVLRRLINAPIAKVRCDGGARRKDRWVTSGEIMRVRTVMAAYQILEGTLPGPTD